MADCHDFGARCRGTSGINLRGRHQEQPRTTSYGRLYTLVNLANGADLAGQSDLTERNGCCAGAAFIERTGDSEGSCKIGGWLNDSHAAEC
jgi:hypothetical protein